MSMSKKKNQELFRKQLPGIHTFVSDYTVSAIDIAEKLGFAAIKIFSKNTNQYIT